MLISPSVNHPASNHMHVCFYITGTYLTQITYTRKADLLPSNSLVIRERSNYFVHKHEIHFFFPLAFCMRIYYYICGLIPNIRIFYLDEDRLYYLWTKVDRQAVSFDS